MAATEPLDVTLVSGALGMGGTEKGLVVHALSFDRDRVRPRVVALQEGGAREAALRDAGIPVAIGDGTEATLSRLLAGSAVVHVFRAGLAEPLVPAAVRVAGVPHLVETNVFGQVDASADRDRFDTHLFVSPMCEWRYRERVGDESPSFHDRHRVLPWPIDLAGLRALAPDRRAAKERLGLDPDRPVVGRIGRPHDTKWRNLLIDMIPELVRLAPQTQVMLVGTTPARRRRLERRGVAGRVHLVDATDDEAALVTRFAACDVFITAAEIGESWSVAICEAMGLGLPIVTCSTPWVDNGQIDQVREGVNGHIADHPRAFGQACAALVNDPVRAQEMGAAAAARADREMDAIVVTRRLQDLYDALVATGRPPAQWTPPFAEIDAFPEEYRRALRRTYRPLTARERAEVQVARRAERLRWAARAASHTDPRTALAWARARITAR